MNRKPTLQLYYRRFFFLRSEMDRLLTLSILFSCMLTVARIIYTGRLTFVFLVWNLFLAYVPYFITQQLNRKPRLVQKKLWFGFLFLLWLLCIPNSFYIITDLFHLGDHWNDYLAPQWYDLALILSFVWNGLLLGILSVRQMEKITEKFYPGRRELFFLYPVMWLNALGVYVGRYLRFNSWDIITNPFQLFRDIAGIMLHPIDYRYAWGMIFCFSILMTLMYLTIKKISKSIH
ncbi:MAG: DUF1361 domain-containing protein [Bacteroidetes bacterium]|nr:DUF1361 domain-containing protein [Bacteroidota bacterium]